MSVSLSLREQLRQQTGEAMWRQAQGYAVVERRAKQPPGPGGLFVLRETAEHPVEWAVLDRDSEDLRRLLAVPADSSSLVGSADIAIDVPRPLTLRCGYATWVDADIFGVENRTGFLEPEDLERALLKQAEVARGETTGSVLEREVDDEAEYREWSEMLDRARQAAPARPAAHDEQPMGQVVPLRRRGWGSPTSLLALAASMLLALTLGLSGWLMQSKREQGVAVAEQRAEVERLEQDRQRLTDEHRRDLAQLREEHREAQLENEQRVAELEAAAQPKPRINLPLVILAVGQLRAGGESVTLAPDADSFMLVLPIKNPQAFPSYRLEVRNQASGRQVWRNSGLTPSRLSELTALLPRSLMPDGRYELRLFGLRGGQTERLMEQILILETSRGE